MSRPEIEQSERVTALAPDRRDDVLRTGVGSASAQPDASASEPADKDVT